MSRNERILVEVGHCRNDRSHFGACTTAGKTDKEVAQIDERFFLACEKLEALKAGLKRKKN